MFGWFREWVVAFVKFDNADALEGDFCGSAAEGDDAAAAEFGVHDVFADAEFRAFGIFVVEGDAFEVV